MKIDRALYGARVTTTCGPQKILGFRVEVDGVKLFAYVNGKGEIVGYIPVEVLFRDFLCGEYVVLPPEAIERCAA